MNNNTKTLRQSLRRRRRQLGLGPQIASARRLAELVKNHTIYHISQHIAFYLPNDGEFSLWPLIRQSWSQGRHCYLPVINDDQLKFARFTPGAPLVSNQFSILEPAIGRLCLLADMDLVLVPLVAFDHWGNRLGMGGGFYDRTFANQLNLTSQFGKKRPLLCGVGHKFQQVAKLTPEPWDIPLDWIAVG